MQFPNAYKGLKKLFISEMFNIAGSVLGLVAAVISIALLNVQGAEGGLVAAAGLGVAAGFLLIAAFVLQLIGLIQGSKDEANFRMAFWVVIFGLVLSLVGTILSLANVSSVAVSILDSLAGVANIIVTIFVLGGIVNLANALSDEDMADKGRFLINAVTILFVISVLLGLFPTFFVNPNQGVSIMLAVFAIVSALIDLIVYINILIYMLKGIKMLGK